MTSAKYIMAPERCTVAVPSASAQAVTWMPSGEEDLVYSRKHGKMLNASPCSQCPWPELAQSNGGVAVPSRAALSWVPAFPSLSSTFISVQGVSESVNKSAVPTAHTFPTASLHKANEGLVVGDVVAPPGQGFLAWHW